MQPPRRKWTTYQRFKPRKDDEEPADLWPRGRLGREAAAAEAAEPSTRHHGSDVLSGQTDFRPTIPRLIKAHKWFTVCLSRLLVSVFLWGILHIITGFIYRRFRISGVCLTATGQVKTGCYFINKSTANVYNFVQEAIKRVWTPKTHVKVKQSRLSAGG